jgi:Ca2+-binding RTX toxin-like protein
VICGFGRQYQIFAKQDADVVYGGRGADTLVGRSGKARLYGWRGDDMIIGRGGLDLHSGQRGRDCLAAEEQTRRDRGVLPRLRNLEVTGPIASLRSTFINGIKHMPVRVELAGRGA